MIPLRMEQRDARDSCCPLQRDAGAGALGARSGPEDAAAGLGGMRDAGAMRSAPAARGRSGWSCCFPRVPSPGKGSLPLSTRARPGHLGGGCRGFKRCKSGEVCRLLPFSLPVCAQLGARNPAGGTSLQPYPYIYFGE